MQLALRIMVIGVGLFLLACGNPPSSTKATVPDFEHAFTINPSYDAGSKNLTVQVRLIEGVHAYAAGEKTGTAVALSVSERNGWKLVEETQIDSSSKSRRLKNEFSLKAKVDGGKGTIFGEMNMQICSDLFCDRPRIHSFSIELPSEKSQ